MSQKRVFITGMGIVSSLGNSVEDVFKNLLSGKSGVKAFPEWEKYNGLNTHLMAPAHPYNVMDIPRKKRRSMSPMAEMATIATFQAMESAGLKKDNPWESIDPKRSLLAMGSTTGSPIALEDHFKKLFDRGGPDGQTSTAFFKIMNHSVAANVALAIDFAGPLSATASACSTSSQAMIQTWELMQTGLYDFAIVGGADEADYTSAAIFDTVQAASTNYNTEPNESPRPFDTKRDGLVISEGAGVVVMETEEHMKKRGAKPLAEFLGGFYFCDGEHMSHPQKNSMIKTMNWALERAGITTDEIGYINAHATSTILGDIEEASAISELFSNETPVSSLKGHFGHSLAACGTIEVICSIEMMSSGILIPNRNLMEIDPKCASIYALQKNTETRVQHVLSNNFAFGGMNASLIIKGVE